MDSSENTKVLIKSLENPILNGIRRPEITNSIRLFFYYLEGKFNTEFDFDVFLPSIGENLQREFVWNEHQQVEFIKSIFQRNYIPNIVVNVLPNNNGNTYKVIDGKQRLTTIKRFINNEFACNGFYYKDVDAGFRSFSERIEFEIYYDYLSDEVLVALFEKVNFFGTAQDFKRFESIKKKVAQRCRP